MKVKTFVYSAFSLIEILLVIGVITIISTVGLPIGLNIFTRQQIVSNRDLLVASLYQAQNLARSGANDSNWGISISSSEIIVFSGNDYATRDFSQDRTLLFSGNITVGGATEIVFEKLSGIPSTAATITLSTYNNTITTNINSAGTVDI